MLRKNFQYFRPQMKPHQKSWRNTGSDNIEAKLEINHKIMDHKTLPYGTFLKTLLQSPCSVYICYLHVIGLPGISGNPLRGSRGLRPTEVGHLLPEHLLAYHSCTHTPRSPHPHPHPRALWAGGCSQPCVTAVLPKLEENHPLFFCAWQVSALSVMKQFCQFKCDYDVNSKMAVNKHTLF